MRRQGQYADRGGSAYGGARMHHMSGQRMEQNPAHFQGQLEAFTPEREQPYTTSKTETQWRWERDSANVQSSMPPQMFNEGQGGVDTPRPYFHGHRQDPKVTSERQNSSDPRSRPHEEDMEIGYEDKHLSHSFESLEQKFLDDVLKLEKEQNDAEDAEIARHREKINAINGQYIEQLSALRARHASRRDEFLQKEAVARQQQYQKSMMDPYPSSNTGPSDPHDYSGTAAVPAPVEGYRLINSSDNYDSYRERAHFLGDSWDHRFEPRGPFPRGRVYDTGARYY